MKTKRLLFYVPLLLALVLGAAGCSSDDDESGKLDASLLPGYWVLVKDGEPQKNGVWFTNELCKGEMWKGVAANAKVVKFWWRMDSDSVAQTKETTYWKVSENGGISIGAIWESTRSVIKLTKDELVIRETHLIDNGKTDRHYKHLQEGIVISE